ncbi:hypothetical protein F5B19DRAFT_242376 [Rostrohypoxylon terebratum]|nr:hypothetical protein F5B19DRAFT_242376 [Rostrohypoxylon terebratum]
MDSSQKSLPLGQKHPRDDGDDYNDNGSQDLTTKRQCSSQELKKLSISGPLVLHESNRDVDNGKESIFNIPKSQQDLAPEYVAPDTFPQFRMLPPELRLKVWRETWKHRKVRLTRITLVNKHASHPGGWIDGLVDLEAAVDRTRHMHATLQHWGFPGFEDSECKYSLLPRVLVSRTRSTTRPPISLWVNRESRSETLMHFQIALASTGHCPCDRVHGDSPGAFTICSFAYFNFNLDILVFPFHDPLSTAFSQHDLSRLTRLSVPELAPALPRFTDGIGQAAYLKPFSLPPLRNEDEVVRYPEFKNVWRYLRKWFPSLREIHLEKFTECEHYNPAEPRRQLPEGLVLRGRSAYCSFCAYMQRAIRRNFPALGLKEHYGPQYDMDCILDAHTITQPVFKKQTLVIGRVKGKQGKKDEPVTVTYWAIYNRGDNSDTIDLEDQTRDWPSTRRKVIARTLERTFGPPAWTDSFHDVMMYYMNPNAYWSDRWDAND